MRSALSHTRNYKLHIFGDLRSINNLQDNGLSVTDKNFDNELEYYSKVCGTCVAAPTNKDITGPQNYILLWHCKIVAIIHHIQDIKRERIYEEPTGKIPIITPIINPKFPETRIFSVSDFESCILYNSKKTSTGATKVKPPPEKEGALTRDNYKVRYFVSTDQSICKTPS